MIQRILIFLLAVVGLVGCSRESERNPTIDTPKDPMRTSAGAQADDVDFKSLADLRGRTCAAVLGTADEECISSRQPGVLFRTFNDYASAIEAVRLGKVDAIPMDTVVARRWVTARPDSFRVAFRYGENPFGYFFAKGSPLRVRVNAILRRMKESGRLDKVVAKWCDAQDLSAVELEPVDARAPTSGVLRFATSGDFEPGSFPCKGEITGFDVDLMRLIASELGMKFELVVVNMPSLVPAVQTGKADVGGGCITITPSRQENVDFTDPYLDEGFSLMTRVIRVKKGGSAIQTLADLKGRTCATQIGTLFQEYLEQRQPGILFRNFNDYPSALEALRLGKVDAVPMDTPIARQWVAQRAEDFRLSASFGENPYGYLFAKGSPLRDRANAILHRMKESGQIDRIVSKWCDASDLSQVKPEPVERRGTASGVLRFATTGDYEPGAFACRGEIVGFDIDLVRIVAAELGRTLEIVLINASAIVSAVQTGKVDMGGGCVTITESRKEKVDFTDAYLDTGFSLIVRKESASEPIRTIRTAADLKGAHVAHLSSDFQREKLMTLQSDLVFDPYTEYAFAFESLRKGKIQAISLGRRYADIWQAKFPGEFAVAFDYADDVCAFLLRKGSGLKTPLDAELKRMNASGESKAIVAKWVEAAKVGKVPPLPTFPAPPADAPVIRVAAAVTAEPWCFVADGKPSGADIELLTVLAHRMGRRLSLTGFDWKGMVDAVNGGKADIGCGGAYTGGNVFATIDVSEKYADEKMCILVRDGAFEKRELGLVTFAKSLRESFRRTFVTESRWQLLVHGLGITLLITVLASALGTVLAFPVWLARTSRNRFVSGFAKGYISVLQGTPVLVLLMVLFYLVFGSVNIDGLWVAVIGFSLNASAYIGEMLRSGVDAIPRGQTEAALALGYGSRQAFFRFVLPQAVRSILPVYRGELIGLLKSTSIVGYIAINDLTKASDLVRSRTYESFFPLLTTAFVYFVAAALLAAALDRIGRRLDPANRRRLAVGQDQEGGK